MLSRPPTKITLTNEDIIAWEQRKAARDQQQLENSQDTTHTTVEDNSADLEKTPAQQTRAAKAQRSKMEREARIGVAGTAR